ncbi:helix-turn-helix domain-containing protein [Streptomyces sp. NPDC051976]|uniref:helix-turn-helix domain-containing protein n=1 Tax=Streptomyces sp. NPDC051976 TaxID=3154947 RepID=UPI0034408612
MLDALGIPETAESLYRELLARPATSPAELAAAAGRDVSAVRRELRLLETHGLVARNPGRPVRFRALPPDLAVEVLALQRHRQIDQARMAAADLTRLWLAANREQQPAVELVRGGETNVQRFLQCQRASQDEVLTLDMPPYVSEGVARQTEVQLELMARGVRYRTVYDCAALADPEQLALARLLAQHGEQARVYDGLPLKLLVTDRSTALVPITLSEDRQSLALTRSPLLDALLALFEFLWERATPLWSERSASAELTDEDAQLLGFAAAGYTDLAISRKLGVNKRTIERRMSRLMTLLGARSRFQAGLQAGRKGLLG